MHCNANSRRMSSYIGDNKLKDKCWMNLLIIFIHFVDFKGSLCFWKAGNYLTFKGPILHLAKAVALLCTFLLVPERGQPRPWALCQGRLLIRENQLFFMCRAIEVLHYKRTEEVFSHRFVSLTCGQNSDQYLQLHGARVLLFRVDVSSASDAGGSSALLTR